MSFRRLEREGVVGQLKPLIYTCHEAADNVWSDRHVRPRKPFSVVFGAQMTNLVGTDLQDRGQLGEKAGFNGRSETHSEGRQPGRECVWDGLTTTGFRRELPAFR